ncbi:MAG: hypothetical protein K2F60_00160 [Oscillospiraceae bacterium]|nr:hypothetical protein [Oscillospiraceae bacterium]
MNEETRKKLVILRAILCVLVIVIVILGWTDIISKTIEIIVCTIVLGVITIWNGIEAIQMKRKGAAVFNFIMAAVILTLCIAGLIL